MVVLLIIFLIICLLILLFTIGFDLYLYFKSVYHRIHIGRFDNLDIWFHKISKVNTKWLNSTPTVKLTDNERYVAFDIVKGHYKSNTIQSWQEAGNLIGAIHSVDSKKEIDTFIKKKIDLKTGKWVTIPKYVDGVILAYAFTKYQPIANKITPLLEETIQLIDNNIGSDGTVFYRNFIPNIRFVDTIGFVCPFLTYYGLNFNKPKYVDLAFNQLQTYIKKAFFNEAMLPAHAYNINTNIPLGIYGWGRGSGWFILGLVDMYNELPNNHKYKQELQEVMLIMANSLLRFQRADGGFNAVLTLETRHDSSITTLAGWLFYNVHSITNDVQYLNAAKACIISLMKVTRRNGAIDFCQGDTKGIGVYATTFDVMPFVQGLTIRLFESIKQTEN